MIIHYQTLGLVIGVVGVMTTIIMIMVWQINPGEKGPAFWAFAALIVAIGFFVLWLRPIIGSYTTFINNSLALTAALLLLEGILRFRNIGDPDKRKLMLILLILFFVVLSFLNRDDPTRRYLIHDALQVVIAILSAFFLVVRTRGLDRIVNGLTAIFFLLLAGGLAYRWTLAISGNIDKNFQNQPIIGVVFFIVLLYMMGWPYGLSIVVNRRARFRVEERTIELEKALSEIKTLSGLLPICASCKKIRDDKGYWNSLEEYLQIHSNVSFSHGMCSECSEKLYGKEDWYMEMIKEKSIEE